MKYTHTTTEDEISLRADVLAARVFDDFSRSVLQQCIKDGNLTINGAVCTPKTRVKMGDVLTLCADFYAHSEDLPENIALDIMYEDDAVLVINKPVGLVVHPGAGNASGTLVNALLWHYPAQKTLPRAGLVHRIDKDTSGLLMIGKTAKAQLNLAAQLKDKSLYRHYICVVTGDLHKLLQQRTIDAPIGRHHTHRTKMCVCSSGKDAITHIKHIDALNSNAFLLDIVLQTGRTHQIRVHLSHIGCPIVGDNTYYKPTNLQALSGVQKQIIKTFARQALHAHKLGFVHPNSGQKIEVSAPLPQDIKALVDALKNGA